MQKVLKKKKKSGEAIEKAPSDLRDKNEVPSSGT